jgi:hypothetical protein
MVSYAPKDRDLPILKKAAKDGARIVDVAGGLFVMLCHPERRGGGDIPANASEMEGIDKECAKYTRLFKGTEDVKGRWRGGRILGTSEIRYEDWPTTEEVLEKGTDISDKVLKYLVAVGGSWRQEQSTLLSSPNPTTRQCSGATPSRHFRLDGEINESTVHCCFAECEDRSPPRVDCRAGVMLVRLRTLREWLLRPSWRKLGFPGSSHDKRSDRPRSSLANNPRQQ